MMRASLSAAVVPVMVLAACASAPGQPATTETALVSHEPVTRPFDKDAPPRIETPSFALELAVAASASTTDPTPISITIEGRGGLHVNLEYPLHIELGGSQGVVLAKTTLAAADASELSEDRARFELDARWGGPGRYWLAARARFAVCTPDTCIPREESLAISVDVR